MPHRDWSSLPQDRATTMLRIYELFGWPPGLLTLQRQLLIRRLRRLRQQLMLRAWLGSRIARIGGRARRMG